jgi:FkbM family methyltransferase
MDKLIKRIVNKFGYTISSNKTIEYLKHDFMSAIRVLYNNSNEAEQSILKLFITNLLSDVELNLPRSKSQLGQDFFALAATTSSSSNFFVEIGGGDPIIASNTYLLQENFGWSGIIVEPNPELAKKTIDTRCNDGKVSVYSFALSSKNGVENFLPSGMLGTFERFIDGDFHSKQRKKLKKSQGLISVETKTPQTFIEECKIKQIDFLSLDTEGSEWEIISNWPFELIRPTAICIEVNNRSSASDILQFLESKNYINVLRTLSKYDHWFVQKT